MLGRTSGVADLMIYSANYDANDPGEMGIWSRDHNAALAFKHMNYLIVADSDGLTVGVRPHRGYRETLDEDRFVRYLAARAQTFVNLIVVEKPRDMEDELPGTGRIYREDSVTPEDFPYDISGWHIITGLNRQGFTREQAALMAEWDIDAEMMRAVVGI